MILTVIGVVVLIVMGRRAARVTPLLIGLLLTFAVASTAFQTSLGRSKAAVAGLSYEVTPTSLSRAFLYTGGLLAIALLVGIWLGSRRKEPPSVS